MDRKFSRIENLWPRDGSCPLPLRSKRIDRVCEAQRSNEAPVGLLSGRTVCDSRWRGLAPTSSTNVSELLRRKISREFHCSCMLIAVCSERSSCPCFAARWPKSRYHARTAHEILKVRLPQKENTAHAVQAKDFVG